MRTVTSFDLARNLADTPYSKGRVVQMFDEVIHCQIAHPMITVESGLSRGVFSPEQADTAQHNLESDVLSVTKMNAAICRQVAIDGHDPTTLRTLVKELLETDMGLPEGTMNDVEVQQRRAGVCGQLIGNFSIDLSLRLMRQGVIIPGHLLELSEEFHKHLIGILDLTEDSFL